MRFVTKQWTILFILPVLSVLAFATETLLAKETAIQKVSETEFVGLENLKYFAQKVRKKEPVVIGYIGGSITVGAGASKYGNNYFWKSKSALENEIRTRGGKATTHAAAIGGTGSGYACYRAEAQLLHKKPDLLIIEFAVNDGQDPNAAESMECLVRQALRTNQHMGIVLLYTTTAALEQQSYSKGELPQAVALHHKVAQHYGLAEVLTGMLVDQRLKKGDFTLKEFFPDGTHPSDVGHALYAKALVDTLIPLFGLPAPTAEPVMPQLLGKGSLEYARLDPVTPQGSQEGWEKKNKWNWFGVPVFMTDTSEKPLSFSAKGKSIQIVYMGELKLIWSVGGKEHTQILTSASLSMPMPSSWRFPKDTNPDGASITAEAIAGKDGKAHGEVWGIFSIQKP